MPVEILHVERAPVEVLPAVWRAGEPWVYRGAAGQPDASYAVQRAAWKARVAKARAEIAA